MVNSVRIAATIAAVCLLSLTYSCGLSRQASASPSAAETREETPSLFTVAKNQLEHLQITAVRRAMWSSTVKTTGTVDWDADHTTVAITQVSGPIARLMVDTGNVVKANDPLLWVASPDVSTAVANYKKARNAQQFAKRTLDRSKDLLEHGVIAQKDYEAAEQGYNDATSDVENSLQALKIFGVTESEIQEAERQGVAINPQLAVRSPISGVIVQKLVNPGMFIQAGTTTCFAISDVSSVWVQGHVYDRDLESMRTGDAVEATNTSFPQVFHGVVSYIGAMVDPATRTIPIRIVTQNPRGLLKKDMFLDIVIHTRGKRSVIAVPTSAILRNDENLPFVYVEAEPGQFAQRLVTIGVQQDEETEILSGLKEGERIVSEGSIFLQFANSTQ